MAVNQHWVHKSTVTIPTAGSSATEIVYVPRRSRFAVSVIPTAGTVTVTYTAVPVEDVGTTSFWETTTISASAVAARVFIDGPVTAIRCVISGSQTNATAFNIVG